MWPILVGLETEYGLHVEGHGAGDQVDDSMALVRQSPDGRFVGWDYRFESPRSDLRGFQVDHLKYDPQDAKFDEGARHGSDREVRSDRVLANGARLYNDHGHPEYATPECWSLRELALQDLAGEVAVLRAARAFSESSGFNVTIYKNNSDGHGASFGTHESYLVPRELGFERLRAAVLPLLVARQVVTGAGKVGNESGLACDYQISQRADFLEETASVDTLFRRPVFNTRDEPHADPAKWIRLHVICGDANRLASSTMRKVGLVKLALWLESIGQAPVWRIAYPARAFSSVSRHLDGCGKIELEGGDWTTARQVVESYVEAAHAHLVSSDPEIQEALAAGAESVQLFEALDRDREAFSMQVDWAAKAQMLGEFVEEEGTDWQDPVLKSYDLAYHDVDPEDSLFAALVELGRVRHPIGASDVQSRLERPSEQTRAWARSLAVRNFKEQLINLSWGTLTFELEKGPTTVPLPPDVVYPRELEACADPVEFVRHIEALR